MGKVSRISSSVPPSQAVYSGILTPPAEANPFAAISRCRVAAGMASVSSP